MNPSTPDLPVHHQLPEFTQTHAHGVRDAIQPSHPLSSPSPPAPIPPSIIQQIPTGHLFYIWQCIRSVFSSVQSLNRVHLFATPWTAALQASLSITNSWSLLKLMSIKSEMPSSHLILCGPLFLLISIFPSISAFPVSQFFASGGQSIGASVSASVLFPIP